MEGDKGKRWGAKGRGEKSRKRNKKPMKRTVQILALNLAV